MKTKLLFLLCLLPLAILAQTNEFTVEDEKIRDVLGKYSMVKIFIVPAVTVLVMALRKWVGLIPDQAWPWLAPFIGVGLDFLASKFGFWTGSVEAGAAMGGLAVWFSQLGKQTREALTDGASTTAAGKTNEINQPPKP